MRKFLVIYDAFELANRGTAVTGRCVDEALRLKDGDRVVLVLPTGQRQALAAVSVASFTKCFTDDTILGIEFGDQILASQIPRESEIWVEA